MIILSLEIKNEIVTFNLDTAPLTVQPWMLLTNVLIAAALLINTIVKEILYRQH